MIDSGNYIYMIMITRSSEWIFNPMRYTVIHINNEVGVNHYQ